MSTPTDSIAPVPILPSDPAYVADKTNPVRFSERVKAWIEGLSPASASQYDTGWIAHTFAGGLSGTIEYRRVGRRVDVRWHCTNTAAAGQLYDPMFTMPVGYRPVSTPGFPQGAVAACYGNSAMPMTGRILPNGQAQVRNNHSASVTSSTGYASYMAD